jgi:hypothetical protein
MVYLNHALRAVLAALAMIAVGAVLWFVVGAVSGTLGFQTPSFVLISTGLIALTALVAGGYVSARNIVPNSVSHAAIAGALVSLLYVSLFTSGLWTINLEVMFGAATLGALGAVVARSRRAR